MSLPSIAEFMADAGLGTPKVEEAGGVSQKAPPKVPGVSKEFQGLLTAYCAELVQYHSLEEMNWSGLARRLGTQPEFLAEAARVLDTALSAHGGFWQEVIAARIKRATAARIFRDSSWENLEKLAVNKLVDLAERNMIRDPGELLAVASAARRVNEGQQGGGSGGNQHTSITINQGMGAESMAENGLPPAGAKMTIDLSPRVASALQTRGQQVAPHGQRVIDGEMISAKDLRGVLEARTVESDSNTEGGE
jgi:hypothetical protein